MQVPLVLLFDIDGTLLHAQGAGRRALSRAFHEVFGAASAVDQIDLRGMTDLLILEAGFLTAQQPLTPDLTNRVLERYTAYLEQELAHSDGTVLLPGVESLLNWIDRNLEKSAIGLGTGNVEAGAYAKLRSVGLQHRFQFGGFGSDHRDRAEILRVGAERGARRLGVDGSDCRTIVLGDTLRDVQAALAIGTDCIAVGTGGVALEQLELAGARLAVSTLEDPRVKELLLDMANTTVRVCP